MSTTLPPPDTTTFVPPADPTGGAPGPRLERPRRGRRIAGVCAAVADRFGWDRTIVRVVTLLSVLLPGPQVLAYVIAWIVIPSADDP